MEEKYASDILTPWNLTKGTGYVYITSLKKFKALFFGQCQTNKNTVAQTLPSNFQIGISGIDVKILQNALISKMAGPAARALAKNGATGYFGTLTKAALTEFQRATNLFSPS